ncbi:hypothetical protein [Nocardia aurea]|uniref:Uncharacterized protein n=1 Tax=Nocardia aurea TaxID=2144174 RepID=A0ABV3FS16_9NOCA
MPTFDRAEEPEHVPRFVPDCRLVAESSRYASKVVRDLRYDDDLTIAVQGPHFSFAHVVFRQPMGFRVFDEADLTEYWNTYSEPHGWLWEVLRGGWLELERQRSTFGEASRTACASTSLSTTTASMCSPGRHRRFRSRNCAHYALHVG